MFSQTTLMGRIVFEPKLEKKERDGKEIKWLRYRLAVEREYIIRGQPKTDFFDCVVFDRKAEYIARNATVGTLLIATGRLEMDSYVNRDNQKIPTIQLRVREQQLIAGWKKQNVNTEENAPEQKLDHPREHSIPEMEEKDCEDYILPMP